MDNEQQKALLEALQKGNADLVELLANEMFITHNGGCNFVEMNAFEKYANCKIVCLERDSFGWLVGGIKYGGKMYMFG
jgi:hypothetical protein